MTQTDICWNLEDIQRAAPIGVETLSIEDPVADAIFLAVHQTVPVGQLPSGATTSEPVIKSEQDLLATFSRPPMDEPLLLFVTGAVGTGKSHMVRWLRSAVGVRPDWHVVYIKKNDTSLTRVIMEIIRGIDTPQANSVREQLQDVTDDSRRTDRMVFRLGKSLEELVKFDEDPLVEFRSQNGAMRRLEGKTLAAVRELSNLLLGEKSLTDHLQRQDGPFWRIVQYSVSREDDLPENFDERALLLQEVDLEIDASVVSNAGKDAKGVVRNLSNKPLLRDVVDYLNSKIGRAKKNAFTGRNTNVVTLFEDVRKVIRERNQELVLFVEDLVVLNGIDLDLAQALTIPAGPELCRIRAAIAVTSGFLNGLDTLRDRGVHYTMDVGTNDVTPDSRRAFVAKYLNAGRVGTVEVRKWHEGDRDNPVPNACTSCKRRSECHQTFGASVDGHGLYPFNGPALDYLIDRASGGRFWPRNIVREVVRNCMETADAELRNPLTFPSQDFAANIDQRRRNLPVALIAELRNKAGTPEQEISLRNFYSANPPHANEDLHKISKYFGISLTNVVAEPAADPDTSVPQPTPTGFSFEEWFQDKNHRVPADEARTVRNWLFESVSARLLVSNGGYTVKKRGERLWVGGIPVSVNDVVIENSAGSGGALRGKVKIEFKRSAEDAVDLQTILNVARGKINGSDGARNYFRAMDRVKEFEQKILAEAEEFRRGVNVEEILQTLHIVSLACGLPDDAQVNSVEAILRTPRPGSNELLNKFIAGTKDFRLEELAVLRSGFVAAKGKGKPSVLDIGPLFRPLTSIVRKQSIADPSSSETLQKVSGLHQRFSDDTWSRLRTCCNDISALLDEGENLTEVKAEIDDLIRTGSIAGMLGAVDAAERYGQAVGSLSPNSMDQLRIIRKVLESGNELESVWQLPVDVQRTMDSLRDWVREIDKILKAVEDQILETSGAGQDDRAILDTALESLAGDLEEVMK